jgi:DNA repair protein RadA/Sms
MDILYISGEESPRQLRLRAERLDVLTDKLFIMNETDMDAICSRIEATKPSLVIIDSIQTMYRNDITSSPGSVSQVRECTAQLMRLSKGQNIPILIVGHVNKEGSIAGPKVMEHMVDAVLYFEGERTLDCRILRAVKNRFGSTNEIGVFEMTERGLEEVENPSLLFLQGKPENVSGIATVGIMEGSRPLVAEVQALVAQTPFPAPRRMAAGFDYNRLNLLIAVLEKRCGMFFGTSDAYLNVIGGLHLEEPAADLAVASALASSLKDFIIPDDTLLIGEVGLAGEIRIVSSLDKRIHEAEKLGFKRCLIPSRNKTAGIKTNLTLIGVSSLREAFNKL